MCFMERWLDVNTFFSYQLAGKSPGNLGTVSRGVSLKATEQNTNAGAILKPWIILPHIAINVRTLPLCVVYGQLHG